MDNWKEILLGPLKDSKLKEHSFVTKVYESQITFDYKKLINKIKSELAYRKRLKELKKKDPFIYK